MPAAQSKQDRIRIALRARKQQKLQQWKQKFGHAQDAEGRALVLGEVMRMEQHSEGWVHGWVQSEDGGAEIPFAGPSLGGLEVGRMVRLSGRWETRETFGERFMLEAVETALPTHPAAVARYLTSHVEKVGPTRALALATALGPLALAQLADDPTHAERIILGKSGQQIAESLRVWSKVYREDALATNLAVEFMSAGMTEILARRAIRLLGIDEAEAVVRLNPYRLVQVPGIGFRTADAVALVQGVSPVDPARLAAGLAWTLETSQQEGNCALPPETLMTRALRELRLPQESGLARLEAALAATLSSTEQRLVLDDGLIFLPEVRAREIFVAHAVARLAARTQVISGGMHSRLDGLIQAQGLAPLQRQGVWKALESGISVLTGRPGTGKTTTVRTILVAAKALGWSVSLCAPTGKAASRASEVCGHPASTIHRLLQVGPGQKRRDPVDADLVILDEASMADLEVVSWLLDNLDLERTRIVFVGDDNQLPSVGAGRILGDLIESGRVPMTQLTEIFRQAQGSRIITNAHALLDLRRMDFSNTKDSDFLFADITDAKISPDGIIIHDDPDRSLREQRHGQQRILRAIQYLCTQRKASALRDIQVLTPMRKGLLGSDQLNILLQDALNQDGERGPMIGGQQVVRVGDRVLQTKNDYTLRLFNGDQGEVMSVNAAGKTIEARFEGEIKTIAGAQLSKLRLAWAMTVHRAQGSEFPYTILAYHTSHHVLLSLQLLYTAITRAKKQLIMVSTDRTIALTYQAAKRQSPRVTALPKRLQRLMTTPLSPAGSV